MTLIWQPERKMAFRTETRIGLTSPATTAAMWTTQKVRIGAIDSGAIFACDSVMQVSVRIAFKHPLTPTTLVSGTTTPCAQATFPFTTPSGFSKPFFCFPSTLLLLYPCSWCSLRFVVNVKLLKSWRRITAGAASVTPAAGGLERGNHCKAQRTQCFSGHVRG